MIRILALLAFFATCGLHAAIKKADIPKPADQPAEKPAAKPGAKPAEKPTEKKPDPNSLEELLEQAQRQGGLDLNQPEFLELLRNILERQGVPKEQLKNAKLAQLMKLLQEKNPNGFGGMLGMQTPFNAKVEKQLDDQFKEMLDGHRPGTTKAAPATFTLRDRKKLNDRLAFATGVNADGWVLTKASEVKGVADLECQVKGEWVAAKVARIWDEHDLALVKIWAKGIPVVQLQAGAAAQVGSFVTAVAPEGKDPVAIGVVSVAARSERTKGTGFLGVSLTSDEKGLKVREIVPGGAAGASGMLKEDRILELDGKKPDSVFTFTKMVSERKAGEKVRLKLQRGDTVIEKEIALGDRGAQPGGGRGNFDKMNGMGSTVSKRRNDFASVLQTDLPVNANQCGGPVTDLDGNIVGIVIARSGRIDTMVIPGETIRQTLAGVDYSKADPAAAPKAEIPKAEILKPDAPKPAPAAEPAKKP